MLVTISYCGMEGSGRNVTEAKKDAARKIEAALSGFYTPYMIRHAENIGIVWREPSGYHYRVIWQDTPTGPQYGNGGYVEESEARRACARHLAQAAMTYTGIEPHLSDADRRELDSWYAWQRRYAKARAAGYDDNAARVLADQRTDMVLA